MPNRVQAQQQGAGASARATSRNIGRVRSIPHCVRLPQFGGRGERPVRANQFGKGKVDASGYMPTPRPHAARAPSQKAAPGAHVDQLLLTGSRCYCGLRSRSRTAAGMKSCLEIHRRRGHVPRLHAHDPHGAICRSPVQHGHLLVAEVRSIHHALGALRFTPDPSYTTTWSGLLRPSARHAGLKRRASGSMCGSEVVRSLRSSMSKKMAPGMWPAAYSAAASRPLPGRYQEASAHLETRWRRGGTRASRLTRPGEARRSRDQEHLTVRPATFQLYVRLGRGGKGKFTSDHDSQRSVCYPASTAEARSSSRPGC